MSAAPAAPEPTERGGVVAPRQALDPVALAGWLGAQVPELAGLTAPDLTIGQFQGGQSNPTYLLRIKDRPAPLVLRRKPPGVLLPSAHAVDREARVLRALASTGVPVPRVLALCTDPSVVGSDFYVMEHVVGRIFWDPTLPAQSPGERTALYDEINRVIALLHGVDPVAVGLTDYGRHGGYVARQVARWSKQYRAAETETIEAADRLIEWLPQNLPPEGETRIVHGDFRIDNVIFHPDEPRIVAVLDWELSTLGDPLVDLAYHCMVWRMSTGRARGLAGLDLATLGIPDEAAFVARYLERTRAAGTRTRAPTVAEWTTFIVFNMFRLVGILQGVKHRALQGNAASADALEMAARTRPLAEQAWALARALG